MLHLLVAFIVKIDEKERLRDAICVLGIGEGTKPAIEVARIVSKVCAYSGIYAKYLFIHVT